MYLHFAFFTSMMEKALGCTTRMECKNSEQHETFAMLFLCTVLWLSMKIFSHCSGQTLCLLLIVLYYLHEKEKEELWWVEQSKIGRWDTACIWTWNSERIIVIWQTLISYCYWRIPKPSIFNKLFCRTSFNGIKTFWKESNSFGENYHSIYV